MSILKKIYNWYLTKDAVPYWCLLLFDLGIVLFSAMFTYWIFYRTGIMFKDRFEVLYSALFYTLLSCIGARLFHTYSGVVRYSSFIDLLRVAYSNGLTMLIALMLSWISEKLGINDLTAFNQTQIVVIFVKLFFLITN